MSRWDGEDLKRNDPPDKDPHPEIPHRDPDEEPARSGRDHPKHPGKPDPDAQDDREGKP